MKSIILTLRVPVTWVEELREVIADNPQDFEDRTDLIKTAIVDLMRNYNVELET